MSTIGFDAMTERIKRRRSRLTWFGRFIHDYGIQPYNFWGNFHHPWLTLRYQYLCFIYGVRNFWRFRRAVWNFDTCDYSGLLALMREATKRMSEHHRDHGHCINADRTAKQLFIVSALCGRLGGDTGTYEELAGYARYDTMNETQRRHWANHSDYLATQDIEYLRKMFRHIQRWWD